jgi:hypothetical protein
MSADESYEMSDVLADDALLDLLAAGEMSDDENEFVELLSAWREELELATPKAPLLDKAPAPIELLPQRFSRATMTAVTVAALVASSGVAAAAVSGPGGPLGVLRRVLFGSDSASSEDSVARQVTALLDAAGRRIAAARPAGLIAPRERASISADLDRAAELLRSDAHAPQTLWDRLAQLRTALTALAVPTAPAVAPAPPSSARQTHAAGKPSAAATSEQIAPAPAPSSRVRSEGGGDGEHSPAPTNQPGSRSHEPPAAGGSSDAPSSTAPSTPSGDGGADPGGEDVGGSEDGADTAG